MTSLSPKQITFLENFGHSQRSPSYVYQPQDPEQIVELFRLVKKEGTSIITRGAGRSYNDVALNGSGVVLDIQGMNRIQEWDKDTGVLRAEPGVTLQQLWQRVLPDGWWPPVVSGTMFTTLAGCVGMNIHGKNNYRLGTIGEHVQEFTAILPTGAEVTCSPHINADLFYAMIGGMGLLGVFTSIKIQMKRVYSGLLNVHAWNVPDLTAGLSDILNQSPKNDYIVGWLDCTTNGRGLGRGQLHTANYLHDGEDPDSKRTMTVDYQTLPDKIFGLLPKSVLYQIMTPFFNNPGIWMVNAVKYHAGRERTYHQSHAGFHFLLDYIPNWEMAYGRGGLIQYQSFLPKNTALDAWTEILNLSLRRGLPSYLGVTKRHRPDMFLLSHSVDGFSLALDFKVTNSNRSKLSIMLEDFDQIILEAGGRFYFAKNSETTSRSARCFLGDETIARFHKLKKRCDPDGLLRSDLFRRIFG
jgi:FAD/FMN-containing dehydrogenase